MSESSILNSHIRANALTGSARVSLWADEVPKILTHFTAKKVDQTRRQLLYGESLKVAITTSSDANIWHAGGAINICAGIALIASVPNIRNAIKLFVAPESGGISKPLMVVIPSVTNIDKAGIFRKLTDWIDYESLIGRAFEIGVQRYLAERAVPGLSAARSDTSPFKDLYAQVTRLCSLEYDWDSDDGSAPSELTVNNAVDFLRRLDGRSLPLPTLHYSGDGDVEFRWTKGRDLATVGFWPDGHIVAYFGIAKDGTLPEEDSVLRLDEMYSPDKDLGAIFKLLPQFS